MGCDFAADLESLQSGDLKERFEKVSEFNFRGEIENRTQWSFPVLPRAAKLQVPFAEANRQIATLRIEQSGDIFNIPRSLLEKDVMQQFPIIRKVECPFHLPEIAENMQR